jgi:outer membrane protein assembly factor BamE
MLLRALAAVALLLLTSCSSGGLPVLDLKPYRMEIQQGNFVSQEDVSKLKPGMSKEQVRFVLGTPLLTDIFHADRWDYVYRRQKANSNVLEHRRIAVFFKDGKLTRVEGDVTPARSAAGLKAAAEQAAPRPATPDASKPAAAAAKPAADQAGAAQAPPAQGTPQKKSWWQWLKDKF